jgi:hypothetical protein
MTVRSRPVGYAPWNPRGASLTRLNQILDVLDDHQEYWPITPRQVLYRLMGRGQATKADVHKIMYVLGRGRRGDVIPWEAVGDERSESMLPLVYADTAAFVAETRVAAAGYRTDRQQEQPVYIEVFVEAVGAMRQVFRTTSDYSIPVYSGSGFNSITALREIVLRAEARDVPTLILIVGDYDPAGVEIRARVEADVGAFSDAHGTGIEVRTVALTEEQVDEFGLFRQPLDARKRAKYPRWPHGWSVELEALAPDDLAVLLRAAIEEPTDEELRLVAIAQEADDRHALHQRFSDNHPNEEGTP